MKPPVVRSKPAIFPVFSLLSEVGHSLPVFPQPIEIKRDNGYKCLIFTKLLTHQSALGNISCERLT